MKKGLLLIILTWDIIAMRLDSDGEVHSVLVGARGAGRYILSKELKPVFEQAYASYDVREGTSYRKAGLEETNLGSWPPEVPDK